MLIVKVWRPQNLMSNYRGKCIGGPKDGELISSRHLEFVALNLDRSQYPLITDYPPNDNDVVNIEARTVVYKFVSLFRDPSEGIFIPLEDFIKLNNNRSEELATLAIKYMIDKYPNFEVIC